MTQAALGLAASYLLFAGAWIYFSDHALELLVPDPDLRESVQTWKGLLFVTVTAVMLFLLVRRQFAAIECEGRAAVDLGARLRLVSDLAGVSLVLLDEKHTYLYANPAYLTLFGLQEEQVVGRAVRDVWPESYETDIRPRLERAFGGEEVSETILVRRRDGAEILCEAYYRQGEEQGKRVVVLVVVDQTERLQAQEALRQSEAKFQLAFANNAAAIAITRLDDGIVVEVNETWERLCGVARAEIVGRTARAMWPTEAEAARFVAELKARGVVRDWEQEFIRGDGTRFVASLTTRLLERGGEKLILSTLVDVTDRRREAAARSEVEALFRHLFDQIPVAVLYCHRDGRLLRANRRLTEVLGFTIEDVPTLEKWWPLAYPDPSYRAQVQRQWTADLAQAEQQGGNLPVREYRMRRRDGGERRVDVSAKILGDEFLIVLQDVTERRAAEEKIRFHERLLEDTGRIAKVGGWSFDVHTGEGYWTNEVARIHDLDPVAPTSKEIGLRFYTVESRQRIEQAIRAAIEKGESYDLQLEIISAKGVRKSVRTIGHPVREHGRVTRLAGSFQDITALRQVEESLRESEERLRQMAENIDEVFWMTDTRKQKLLYVSPAFERVWGRSTQSLSAHPLSWIEAVVPSDRERIRAALSRQPEGNYAEEYRIQRPDGTTRWISDRAFPVRDAAGAVYRVVGVARDITEKKRLEEQFLRAQRLEAIGSLATGVAHDLNNLLAPITMFGSLLREKLADPDDRKMLALVEGAAQRGAGIVAQLLAFSRGIGGERGPVQVEQLAGEVTRLLEATLPRTIHVTSRFERELPPVQGNPTQIHQVLMNLCVNARDAMPTGGQLTLVVRRGELTAAQVGAQPHARPGACVVLSVEDTGGGIPPEVRTRLFEPFFTTKAEGRGTGLGLPTVLGIVRSHGGVIEVDSVLGRGTRFDIYLPVAPTPRGPAATPTLPDLPTGHGELVLVVDDEDVIRAAVAELFTLHHYEVLTASSAEEAWEQFEQHRSRLRVVVADVMLRGASGWELTQRLLAARPDLPVIICSGVARPSEGHEQLATRVRAILPKPFQADEMLRTVAAALGR